jgi:lysophospholipid acyltransferase (LPLAT)-like uncharacterized protein
LGNPLGVWLNFRLVPFIAAVLVRILSYTLRVTYQGLPAVEDLVLGGNSIILAFYHRRLVMMPLAYPFRQIWRGGKKRGVATLTSDSKDGERAAFAYHHLGIHIVRGTATHSGVQALVKMIQVVKDGWDLGIALDGPHGPPQVVKGGAIVVSRKTGAYLVPVCVVCRDAWELRSWDRMVVPKPFSRVVVSYREPWRAPADGDDEASVRRLQEELDALEA